MNHHRKSDEAFLPPDRQPLEDGAGRKERRGASALGWTQWVNFLISHFAVLPASGDLRLPDQCDWSPTLRHAGQGRVGRVADTLLWASPFTQSASCPAGSLRVQMVRGFRPSAPVFGQSDNRREQEAQQLSPNCLHLFRSLSAGVWTPCPRNRCSPNLPHVASRRAMSASLASRGRLPALHAHGSACRRDHHCDRFRPSLRMLRDLTSPGRREYSYYLARLVGGSHIFRRWPSRARDSIRPTSPRRYTSRR